MTRLVFPTAADVAAQLKRVNDLTNHECEVRLQVYPTGAWVVRFGDPGYDQDHHGYWASSTVPGLVNWDPLPLARALLEEAAEDCAMDDGEPILEADTQKKA